MSAQTLAKVVLSCTINLLGFLNTYIICSKCRDNLVIDQQEAQNILCQICFPQTFFLKLFQLNANLIGSVGALVAYDILILFGLFPLIYWRTLNALF